jgi:glyoxylase-like metal-dependent hydrolase (beta-lactamase superfamily II)
VGLGLLGLVGCLTVPLEADRSTFAVFAAPAPARAEVRVTPLRTGMNRAPRCAAAGEASCLSREDFVHAAYLVKHPRGTFIIDANVSARVEDDLARLSFVQRQAFAFTLERGLAQALADAGQPHVDFVLLTHAHWDHTSGLPELDRPRVVLGPGEADFVKTYPADDPTVMPEHLKGAALETFAWDGPPYENFLTSHDWFGDGSVVLVPLPGHTPGSVGVFVQAAGGHRLLFVGDAAWSLDAIAGPSHKLGPVSDLTDRDRGALSGTLWRLHHLRAREPDLLMVPAHDGRALAAVAALAQAAP